MRPHLAALLELHASSESLKKSHDLLVESGHAEVAAIVHEAGKMLLTAIGKFVVAESKREREAVKS